MAQRVSVLNGGAFFMTKNGKILLRLTTTAVMIAMSVVLCRLLGFPQTGTYRIELGFLPIAVVAMLYGPLWAGAAYGIADLIGAAIFTGINPFITLCKIAFGVIMGLFFYRREKVGLLRCVLCFLIVGAAIDIVCMCPIFVFMFGYTWKVSLTTRTIAALINTPARIVVFWLVSKYFGGYLIKSMGKNEKTQRFSSYANGFQAVPRLGLERISCLMELLGDPQERLHCIHVAGTNGKGSVCAFLEAMLRSAGFCVGKYISPNLVRVNERITINGKEISDGELSALLAHLETESAEVRRRTGEIPSQFEIWTAAAFCYFAEKSCDYVILETGLGGEFDATNVISGNVMAVLTHIDFDHTQLLGDTLAKIAETKSKILKAKCETGAAVSSHQAPDAMRVLAVRAEECGVRLVVPGEAAVIGFHDIYEIFSYDDLQEMTCGLGGPHQVENACTAIECAKILGLSHEDIRYGVEHAKNPARLEKLSENPTVLYDGAHNPDGVAALIRAMDRYFPDQDRTVVFACMKDKDYLNSLHMLMRGGVTKFIFTAVSGNERAMPADALASAAAKAGIAGDTAPNLTDAVEKARGYGNPVFICGSLYLYADLERTGS